MGYFRFRRSIRLAPGIRWNIGKKSSSITLGGHGLTHTIGSQGSRTTIGIPGSGLSYTQVHPNKPAVPTPPTQSSPSPVVSHKVSKQSKFFYVVGVILLGIWLVGKVSEQSTGPKIFQSSSTSALATPTQTVLATPNSDLTSNENGQARSRYPSSTASKGTQAPHLNDTVALARSSIQPTAIPSTAAAGAAMYDAAATPVPTPVRLTYRVVNVASSDYLFMRAGPGSAYDRTARMRPTTRGIAIIGAPVRNGTTVWRKVSAEGFVGWVNEIYLEAE